MKRIMPAVLAVALALVCDPSMLSARSPAEPEPLPLSAGLAQELQNPIAYLVSMPVSSNWDFGGDRGDSTSWSSSFEPVVPFRLNRQWNLITRTVVPLISGEELGLGDIGSTFYFSPSKRVGGNFVGFGPGLVLPTATDDSLGTGKWSAGPSAVVVRQDGSWTIAMLAGHAWSVAGVGGRGDVSASRLWPVFAYTTSHDTTFAVEAQSTCDWQERQWTVPVEVSASQSYSIGAREVSAGLSLRYYVAGPTDGPVWGLSAFFTFAFVEAHPPGG